MTQADNILFITVRRTPTLGVDNFTLDSFAEANPKTIAEALVCLLLLNKTADAIIQKLLTKYGAESHIEVRKK